SPVSSNSHVACATVDFKSFPTLRCFAPNASPLHSTNNRLAADVDGDGVALPANMSETATPWKFSVEGESGSESDERIGAGPGGPAILGRHELLGPAKWTYFWPSSSSTRLLAPR